MQPGPLADLLRDCIATGDFAQISDVYAPGAELDASLPGARVKRRGPEAIAEVLSGCFEGPGRMVEWTPTGGDGGVAAWVERVDDGGAVRQRHYLHVRDGLVARHWVYAARPRTAEPDAARRRARPLERGSSRRTRRASPSGRAAGRDRRMVGQPDRARSCSPTAAP